MTISPGADFPESVKLDAKKLAAFRCCLCYTRPGDEVHHIQPKAEGGSNDLGNAVLLCAQCHNDYGTRAERRKFIRQSRDFWHERVRAAYKPENIRLLVQIDSLATKADLDGMQREMQTMMFNLFSSVRQGSTSAAAVVNVASAMVSSITTPPAYLSTGAPACTRCGAALGLTSTGYRCDACGA